LGDYGFETLPVPPEVVQDDEEPNAYTFVDNSPTLDYDPLGLMPPPAKRPPNPHRKNQQPKNWDKHSKGQGRPKAGAKPGKTKPNMQQNNCTIAPVDQMPIGDLPPIRLPSMPEFPIEDPIFIW
jgi:hypothetical protein